MWLSILNHPEDTVQVRAAMFGTLLLEEGQSNCIPEHPWITQLGPMSLALATVGNEGPLDRTEGFQFEIGTQF